jgi:uncharacterized protein (TIGR02647 family)
MTFSQDTLDELNILLQYDLSNTEQGIKIHHDASQSIIKAAIRLFNKGLIDKTDGGYLTPIGIKAAEHTQSLSGLLTVDPL